MTDKLIAQFWADKFRAALKGLDSKACPKQVDPKIWEATKAAMRSQLEDLEKELA